MGKTLNIALVVGSLRKRKAVTLHAGDAKPITLIGFLLSSWEPIRRV